MRFLDDLGWSSGTYTTFTVTFYGLFLWVALFTEAAGKKQSVGYVHPIFIETPNNITAVMGSDVTLPCSVHNLGTKSVIWKKTDNLHPITIGEYVYSPDKKYSISRNDPYESRHGYDTTMWNLQIQDVTFSHEGTYECQLSTKEDYGRNVTLHVIEDRNARGSDKRTGIKLTGTNFVEKGETIVLNCSAYGAAYNAKGVDWFKEGLRLKDEGRLLISQDSSEVKKELHSRLEVEKVTMQDAGTYVCRVSQEHVQSVKVVVLNTDSSNKRRGTGADGLEVPNSENQIGRDSNGATMYTRWSSVMLISFIAGLCLS